MSLKMRIASFLTLMVATTLTLEAHAQYGYGMPGAVGGCPIMAAAGATDVSDDVKEAQEAIKEAKRKISQKKSDKKKFDRDVERYEKDINDNIEGKYAEFIIQHIQNGRSCEEYDIPDDVDAGPAADTLVGGTEGGRPIVKQRKKKLAPTGPFKNRDEDDSWGSYCGDRGGVSSEVCTRLRPSSGRTSASNCAKALPAYRKAYSDAQKAQDEIDGLERGLERLNDNLKDARQAAIDERKSATEGGICIECMQKAQAYAYQQQQPNYLALAAGVGMGLVGMYAGYQTNKTIAQYNSNIGMPTQQAPLYGLGYGMPYFQAGLYGAMAGTGGQGGFGCGGSMGGGMNGMGGMYNPLAMGGGMNPYGQMGGGLGGGMYMPGMSPYGMGGMGGMNPYGMGGLGGGLGMGMGGMNPYGMGMNPYGMGAMGQMGMNPYGMGGYNPMMGGLGAGGIGAGFGMNPYGMGGLGGGLGGYNPYGMGGLGGGLGGYNPYGMGGLGGGLGGYNPYGMGGIGGMNPYGMGGMGMDPMQMQMQQLQMQQYQQYAASQQQAMQDAMNRQRTVAGLQTELYGLMNRIQQAQMGIGVGSTGSYLGTGGYNSGTFSGTGSITGGISGGGAGYLSPYTTTSPYYPTGTTATTPLGTGR